MKTKNKVPVRFAPPTRFDWTANRAAPFRATQEDQFERLKTRLLAEELRRASDIEFVAPLRCAANEAAALAWATLYPLLIFPALFEEKTLPTKIPSLQMIPMIIVTGYFIFFIPTR